LEVEEGGADVDDEDSDIDWEEMQQEMDR